VDQPRVLLRDHDLKFTEKFDEILTAEGVGVKAVVLRRPTGPPRARLLFGG
jgi:hypothetical protein